MKRILVVLMLMFLPAIGFGKGFIPEGRIPITCEEALMFKGFEYTKTQFRNECSEEYGALVFRNSFVFTENHQINPMRSNFSSVRRIVKALLNGREYMFKPGISEPNKLMAIWHYVANNVQVTTILMPLPRTVYIIKSVVPR
jgi:hypothetical protein